MMAGYNPVANMANRYQQNRDSMQAGWYSGIIGTNFQAQDTCVTEGEGPIQDRTNEHLGYADKGVIAARKVLLAAIRQISEGSDPLAVVRDPFANNFPGIVAAGAVIGTDEDYRTCW
jgi:phthalate 4,5-dioxygenase oxygenase subunit